MSGQRLRSGSYMAANEAGQASKISSIRVSTLSGEPRGSGNMGMVLDPQERRHVVWPGQTACGGRAWTSEAS